MPRRTPHVARVARAVAWALLASTAAALACRSGEEVRARAPVVLADPSGQVVREGGQATFTAAATGRPAPALQWERLAPGSAEWLPIPGATGGAWSDLAGATSPSYTVLSPAPSDDGARFRAVATSAAGTVATAEATLTVVGGPAVLSFTAEPARITAGGSTSLRYAFTGGRARSTARRSAAPPGPWP